jgi:hypothetical protein
MFKFIDKIISGSFENYVIVVILAYAVAGVVWFLCRRVSSPLARRAVRASMIFWVFPIIIPAGHGFIFCQPWIFLLMVAASGEIGLPIAILGIWVIVLLVSMHNVKT